MFHTVGRDVGVPRLAGIVNPRLVDRGRNLVGALDELQSQALGRVPANLCVCVRIISKCSTVVRQNRKTKEERKEYPGVLRTYVTVEQPNPRVVRDKGKHQVAIRVEHRDIATRRILNVERSIGVKLALALRQDPKVVTVEMNGVMDRISIVDDKVRPLVGLRQRDDMLRRVEGRLAIYDLLDG